jgi:hypothetical protein
MRDLVSSLRLVFLCLRYNSKFEDRPLPAVCDRSFCIVADTLRIWRPYPLFGLVEKGAAPRGRGVRRYGRVKASCFTDVVFSDGRGCLSLRGNLDFIITGVRSQ